MNIRSEIDLDHLSQIHGIVKKLASPESSLDDPALIQALASVSSQVIPSHEAVIPGKGEGNNYSLFCRKCFLEYKNASIERCTRCGNRELLTKNARHAELKGKVEVLRNAYESHKKRKDEWSRYRLDSRTKVASKQVSTDYERWRKWEPNTSEDDAVRV